MPQWNPDTWNHTLPVREAEECSRIVQDGPRQGWGFSPHKWLDAFLGAACLDDMIWEDVKLGSVLQHWLCSVTGLSLVGNYLSITPPRPDCLRKAERESWKRPSKDLTWCKLNSLLNVNIWGWGEKPTWLTSVRYFHFLFLCLQNSSDLDPVFIGIMRSAVTVCKMSLEPYWEICNAFSLFKIYLLFFFAFKKWFSFSKEQERMR